MSLTEHALKSMGYTPLPDGSVLRGTFTRIYVFEVRGFTMEAPALAPVSGRLHGTPFCLCVGNSLNALFRELTDDEFGDEEQWRKERRSSPPFVIVKLGPTQEHIGTVKNFKESGERIQRYEGFNAAKSELDSMADAVVPALMTSLTLLEFRTLSDRFVWCALKVWTHLSDSDGMKFRDLKQIRVDCTRGAFNPGSSGRGGDRGVGDQTLAAGAS